MFPPSRPGLVMLPSLRRLFAAALLIAGLGTAAFAQTAGPTVDVLQVSGPIDAPIARYLERALNDAAAREAEVVVLQLDTVGALGAHMDALVERILDSPVPVAVWVGPAGARVSGGGVLLAEAAHVLAMAPATVLGGATPVALDEPEVTDAERQAVADRLAELASRHGRDPDAAAAFARGAAVVASGDQPLRVEDLPADALPYTVDPAQTQVTDPSSARASGVVDVLAGDLDDVLRELDRREVRVATPAGLTARTLDVDPATTSVRFNNLGLIGRVLHTVANPTLAYLLLIGGALAIAFELYQPGFGVAGISGLAMATLAVYGLAVLPVRWWALALIIAGLALLAVDLALAGLGALTASGAVALAAGSLLLFDDPPPLQAPAWLLLAVVAFAVLFFVVIMTVVLRAQGAQPQVGAEQVVGEVGVVRSMLNPEGHVFVGGALWRARAPDGTDKVKTGTRVRVTGIGEGGTLDVVLVEADQEAVKSADT